MWVKNRYICVLEHSSITLMPRKKKDVIDLSYSLSDIWRMLTDVEREKLRNNARVLQFRKNDLIYLEDEWPKDLMCLFKGKVKIYKSGVGGRSQIIRIVRPCSTSGIVPILHVNNTLPPPPLSRHAPFA